MARKIQERRGCRRPLPAMLSDCTLEGQGPAIMEEACPSPQAHERFRPKLGPPGYPLAKIGERRPHIVQQQIRIEMDHLAIERLDRARRDECWDMTLRTPEPMKEFATFVISTEWRGWGEESNEVDREIPIGRAQLAGHVNTLLGRKGTGDKGWQIRISCLPAEAPELSIRKPGSPPSSPTRIGFDRAFWDGLDETKAEEHRGGP